MSLEEKARKLIEVEKQRANVDWNAVRDWWIGTLNDLYDKIEGWLAPLEQQGLVIIRRESILLIEGNLGEYSANELILEFGSEEIVLEPQGTLIYEASGRVDLFRRGYRSNPFMLILSGSYEEPKWEIWPNRDPRQRKPMIQSEFENAVESLLEVQDS